MLADTYSKCELLKNKIKKYIEDIQLIDIEYGIYSHIRQAFERFYLPDKMNFNFNVRAFNFLCLLPG